MSYHFALLGNPNCGKTTLFNCLTGSHAHVGNWPGVTVERKEGKYLKSNEDIKIVDLPGIYSLSPYSEEEVVSRDYILTEKPDLIINIVDATNFERNLYLTSQLVETGIPVVIALNMMDEIEKAGDSIDLKALKNSLSIDIVPIIASKGIGIDELMKCAIDVAQNKKTYKIFLDDEKICNVAEEIRHIVSKNSREITFFSAIKLLENDEATLKMLNLDEKTKDKIAKTAKINEEKIGQEWEIYIADMRYKFITNISSKCIKRKRNPDELTITDRIDMIVTNKYLALPIFIIVMIIIFQITFGDIGSFFTDKLDYLVNDVACAQIKVCLENMGASRWAIGLVAEGICKGVGMVLIFLPQILLLFFFLSILEDTGYMARAAFIMDRLLRRFGLSGKSFVPLIMGFGCSVPAIMATRTLENERDRRMTIILTPFMSCGARMPVYAVFASAFFASNKGFMVASLYLLGIGVALISALILKSTVLKGETATFIMELPTYRMPAPKTVIIHVWEKAKEFIVKAFTILLAASIVIWFLQNFDFSLHSVANNGESIFATIGKFISPLFAPLGFGDWKPVVALLTGFVAKEAVVSTLGILYGCENVSEVLANYFSPLSAYSYLVFILLYMPCVVAFATIRKEMKSIKWTLFAVVYQTAVAWVVSFLIYQIGSLFLA